MLTDNQISELDRLWSIAIKNIYKGRCAISSLEGHDPHHIFKRGNLTTRWHLVNGILLNRKVHDHTTKMKERVKEWFINKYSEEAYDELRALSNSLSHNLDYDIIRKSLIPYQKGAVFH